MLKAAAIRTSALKWACVAGLLAAAVCTVPVHARQTQGDHGLGTVAAAELPPQGRVTYQLIREGGPFPYDKDGTVFGNRERLLPAHKRGYYREYTVKTPGARNRGARRIVCAVPAAVPSTCYYTADHYASFREIVD